VKRCTLSAWRLRVSGLTQQDAADAAGIPLAHASAIESRPERATLGALRAYVAACGGRLELVLVHGAEQRRLVL
jgi:hypothetical protein